MQQIVQNMEHQLSAMVSQDVVTSLENTIDTLRAELKRLEATHRKLLNRYASLKAVVDDCFKKFVNERQSFSEAFDEETRAKIASAIDESVERRLTSKTKNESAFDSSEKVSSYRLILSSIHIFWFTTRYQFMYRRFFR